MLLPASLLMGVLWQRHVHEAALLTGAGLSAVAAVLLWTTVPEPTASGTAAAPARS